MDEEELNNQEDRELLKGTLLKYEEMVKNNDRYFFDVDAILHLAEYFQNRGQSNRAFEVASYGLDLHPEAINILLKKAQLASAEGKNNLALQMLEKAESSHPYEAELWLVKAKIYDAIEEYKECISCLKTAIGINDSDGYLYSELAAAYQMVYDYDNAIKNYKIAFERMPQDELILAEFYTCLLSSDRVQDGLLFFQKMIDDDPYNADAWFYYASLLAEVNSYKEAIKAFDYCLVIDDMYDSAYIGKGDALANIDDHKEAIVNYKLSLECIDPDVNVYTSIAESYDQMD
ncbi:MAG: tetratricopeptide repeat protein, partial [Bacteroidia bacterium]|nr:tetratricopeptide repeat protein [Bacteroidia bacterium]